MTESDLPLFIGISRRADHHHFGWDLMGVSTLVIFPFLPQPLTGLYCVLGRYTTSLPRSGTKPYRLVFTEEGHPENHGWIDLRHGTSQRLPVIDQADFLDVHGLAVSQRGEVRYTLPVCRTNDALRQITLFALQVPPLLVFRPCSIAVEAEIEGTRYPLGTFLCAFVQPPPLSDEERRAIASRPNAARRVTLSLECQQCRTRADYYLDLSPLDPPRTVAPIGALSLADAPASWSCRCGAITMDLAYLKTGLHDAFRWGKRPSLATSSELRFLPLYEAGRVENILAEYERLIEIATDEETVQQYFERHPILWAFLSPVKILYKPPVLTKKRADFGIVSAQKILYLVELEKPRTRLVNRDGSISQEIQRGAEQIRDWQLIVGNDRRTFLSELGIKEEEVQEIHYLLVGGLARRTNIVGLTKLRRSPLAPNTAFYSFDELGLFLHSLATELRSL